MLKVIFAVILMFSMLKSFQAAYTTDFPPLGAEIKAPFPSICKMYETSVDSLNAMKCFSNVYAVKLLNLPTTKSYTHRTFCPPSPQFAIFYYNLISRKNKNSRFNVTVCKQKFASISSTYNLYCEEMQLKDINCEDIYLGNDEPNNASFVHLSYTTTDTTTTESPTTSTPFSKSETENYRNYANYGRDVGCNQWICLFNHFITFLITTILLGLACFYFFSKWREEKLKGLYALEKLQLLHDFTKYSDASSERYVNPNGHSANENGANQRS